MLKSTFSISRIKQGQGTRLQRLNNEEEDDILGPRAEMQKMKGEKRLYYLVSFDLIAQIADGQLNPIYQ